MKNIRTEKYFIVDYFFPFFPAEPFPLAGAATALDFSAAAIKSCS
jgi:hypothetical protein